MTHEIGYHHECLAKAKGDFEKAISIFKTELKMFREFGYLIYTVCFHGGSSSYLNTKLLDDYDFSEFRIL